MYLGVRAVLVKSLARIHRANLINWGILPLEFADPADYEAIEPGDRLRLTDLAAETVQVVNPRTGRRFGARANLTDRERRIVLAGGVLAYTRQQSGGR
jgi:aconitate hydratase